MIRQCLDSIRLGRTAPAFLGERQIRGNGQDHHPVAQTGGFLVESPGLLVADRGIQRGDHADEAHLAGGIGQPDGFEVVGGQGKVGGRVTRLQLGPDQRQWIP